AHGTRPADPYEGQAPVRPLPLTPLARRAEHAAPGGGAPRARRTIPRVNEPTVRVASFAELDAPTLYRLLKLRVDVFVVEQKCAYPELDGRDLEPETRHLWIEDGAGAPLAYLRVLREPDGAARIGRVVTAPHA